ncbi:hypothetical protein NC99_09580 [Sunxiuqinia dokdonensis]|uniref:Uncharacterized protein n=1 Tax=Sunxiuqinia dokdonensis TaxID=1409788 RepID=A0A0L8VCP0_9BACT|nr:hypothetical protein NC99_09580 [Sunxiuqinia dokdonensis]
MLIGHRKILKTGNNQAPAVKSTKPMVAGALLIRNNKQ